MAETLKTYIEQVIERNASDLHFSVGQAVDIRVDDELLTVSDGVLSEAEMDAILKELIPEDKQTELKESHSVDFSYDYEGKARFRVNVYEYKGKLAAALRLIPAKVMTIEELGLPEELREFASNKQGMVLAVGPAGHGKTTTIAAMIEHINANRADHIITIEDPIEYLFEPKKSMVNQREVGEDTRSFPQALKMALRQDPDVVVVGEMRDLETIQAAITLAETGHLIFSTLHTNDASQTIDRMIDVFPPHQQQQVRIQLAESLMGIVSQRLVPKINGGRAVAVEVLKITPAVRNLIREGKAYQIKNVIQTSGEEGMRTLEVSLAHLVASGEISEETAYAYALDKQQLANLL